MSLMATHSDDGGACDEGRASRRAMSLIRHTSPLASFGIWAIEWRHDYRLIMAQKQYGKCKDVSGTDALGVVA